MTPDHSALIERLEAATGFPFGTYAGEAGKPLRLIHSSDLTDAANALREAEGRHEGMEEDLYQAVLVAYRRGAVEWTMLNYPQWINAISAGREVCPLPSAPNQAKEAGE